MGLVVLGLMEIACLLPFTTAFSLMILYRRIGKDLSNTFAKLEKLTICECLVDLS